MNKIEAIKILKSKMDGSVDTSYEWCEAIRLAINALEEEPQRAKGHLISNQQDGEIKPFWERYRCSVCGEYAQDNFNYCSRCGAELEGEEE